MCINKEMFCKWSGYAVTSDGVHVCLHPKRDSLNGFVMRMLGDDMCVTKAHKSEACSLYEERVTNVGVAPTGVSCVPPLQKPECCDHSRVFLAMCTEVRNMAHIDSEGTFVYPIQVEHDPVRKLGVYVCDKCMTILPIARLEKELEDTRKLVSTMYTEKEMEQMTKTKDLAWGKAQDYRKSIVKLGKLLVEADAKIARLQKVADAAKCAVDCWGHGEHYDTDNLRKALVELEKQR